MATAATKKTPNPKMSEAGRKAAITRKANAQRAKWAEAGRKSWATRRKNAKA
jgi:hypothetical protein